MIAVLQHEGKWENIELAVPSAIKLLPIYHMYM